jgi:hypothetical protein
LGSRLPIKRRNQSSSAWKRLKPLSTYRAFLCFAPCAAQLSIKTTATGERYVSLQIRRRRGTPVRQALSCVQAPHYGEESDRNGG